MSLEYFLSVKGDLVVIALKGELSQSCGPQVQQCLEESSQKAPAGIVLHMAEVALSKDGHRLFTQFFRALKSATQNKARISALNRETAAYPIEGGVLASSEVKGTLQEAVQEIAALVKG